MDKQKTVAKFMGLGIQLHMVESPLNGEYIYIEDLEYNSSWDWLMPVVEKIERTNNGTDDNYFNVTIGCGFDCTIFDAHHELIINTCEQTKIKTVYKAVVEFIEWYNKNKED